MKEKFSAAAKAVEEYAFQAIKWAAVSAVIGLICGLAGSGFHMCIDLVTEVRSANTWIIWLLPAGGIITLLLYKLCKVSFGAGTNLIIDSVSTNEPVPIALAPLIFIGTALSHLFGASVGREGAALQLGGSIGHNFGKLIHLKKEDVQVASMCGMAACFSALFGTPLTAAVFVLEVICIGTLHYNALLPCVVASYSAFGVTSLLGIEPMAYSISGEIPALSLSSGLRTAALGVLAGLLGIVFCTLIHKTGHVAEKFLKSPYVRIAAGGILMAALTSLFGLFDYAGAGGGVISGAISGESETLAFVIKLLLTAICVGTGFRGGEIVPTLFVGSTFGCIVGPVLGLPASFSAALCLIALFCSVVNCPIASLFMAAELFGTAELPLFAIIVAVAFVVSGYFGLYSSQKIRFSKVRPAEINKNSE